MTKNIFPSEQQLFKQIMLTNEIVWGKKIIKNDVDNWLSNFKGDYFSINYERNLALWLLANFVYYNESEVRHLCKILFRDFIHWKIPQDPNDIFINIQKIIQKTMFFNLGKPGESSAYILYYFRQENNIRMDRFSKDLTSIPDIVDTIVFVEDVIISGEQADIYLRYFDPSLIVSKKIVLLTFISTEKAVKEFLKIGIEVIAPIILDERDKCFSKNSSLFINYPEHRNNCRILAGGYGRRINPDKPLGYKNGQYSFGFFHNIPDNTLPIFWSINHGWIPILKRYDKVYKGELHGELGTFI